jgi:uncharacterized protein YqcC (DUF446 family)
MLQQLNQDISALLQLIEAEMMRRQLWSEQPPGAEALASAQPFCVDTLSFEQWLQFVFVPTLHGIIASGDSLPETCAVAPMAEMALPGRVDTKALVDLLRQADVRLSKPRQAL